MLNVAYVGALYHAKGSFNLFSLLLQDLPVKWFVIGWVASYDESLKNATVYGSYKTRTELYDMLDIYNIDLVIMPNECHESFSYTMSEVWECGIPILGTNRGAIQSRIEESGCGWISDPKLMGEKLRWLDGNPDEFNRVLSIAHLYKVPTLIDMCNNYNKLYEELC